MATCARSTKRAPFRQEAPSLIFDYKCLRRSKRVHSTVLPLMACPAAKGVARGTASGETPGFETPLCRYHWGEHATVALCMTHISYWSKRVLAALPTGGGTSTNQPGTASLGAELPYYNVSEPPAVPCFVQLRKCNRRCCPHFHKHICHVGYMDSVRQPHHILLLRYDIQGPAGQGVGR